MDEIWSKAMTEVAYDVADMFKQLCKDYASPEGNIYINEKEV